MSVRPVNFDLIPAKKKAHYKVWTHPDFINLESIIEVPYEQIEKQTSFFNVMKNSRSTWAAIGRTKEEFPFFIKSYKTKSFRYIARYVFRESRAIKAWQYAFRLLNCGICTPVPLAALEERCCGLILKKSVLITTFEKDQLPITDRVHLMESHPAQFRLFLNSVVSNIALMHDEEMRHRDLKMTNIYVADINQLGKPEAVGFWDLDGMSYLGRRLSSRERSIDYARFLVSTVQLTNQSLMTLLPIFTELYNDFAVIKLDVELFNKTAQTMLNKKNTHR